MVLGSTQILKDAFGEPGSEVDTKNEDLTPY